jgi:hypothetical protein
MDSRKPQYQFFDVVLNESSLVDLTDSVVDGKLRWIAPSDHSNYTLFAVYERFTNQRSVDATPNATELIGNGSWISDHFSARGAQLIIDFWEDRILDNDAKDLLKAVGEHCKSWNARI